jgi:sarcosine oxidase
MHRAYDVIVVGLGAMGSAAAYQLASRGVRVLGIDAHHPPHLHGSHHGESRIIRKAYYEHPAYVPLLERTFALWAELAERSGARLLLKTGGLMIGTEAGELVSGVRASVRAHGLAHEFLSTRAVATRYPLFHLDPAMVAVWEADAGILFPESCIRAFLDGATAAHAALRFSEPVQEWKTTGAGVQVTTTRGVYAAGALVLAAGIGMRDLVAELRPQLRVERQVFAHFEPAGDRTLFAPTRFSIFCIEEPDGAFFYGFPDLGGGCKFGRHHDGAIGEPADLTRDVTESDIADLRGFLARRIPAANGTLADSAVCRYTNTPDFHFVIDRHPRLDNVIVASVCSGHGFKFSAVVGEIIADLVAGTTPAFDLSMFRIARLLPGMARAESG